MCFLTVCFTSIFNARFDKFNHLQLNITKQECAISCLRNIRIKNQYHNIINFFNHVNDMIFKGLCSLTLRSAVSLNLAN